MYAGRKVEEAETDELFENPAHPYTRGLLAAIPHMGDGETRRLNEIEGMVPALTALPPGCAFAPRCGSATDRCRQDVPVLEALRPGHWVACWNPESPR